MTKLTADLLTPEQLDLLQIVRQEYTDALTNQFDDDDIIEKVKWIYNLYGLSEPRVHILDYPQDARDLQCYPTSYIYNDSTINKILFELWKQLRQSVDESIIDLAKKHIENKLYNIYDENIRLERIICNISYGSNGYDMERKYNVPIIALYDYLLRIGAIKINNSNEFIVTKDNKLERFLEYIRSGMRYRSYYSGHAFVIRNPNGPKFEDELGRLNNEKGYAVVWGKDKQGNDRGFHFVKGVYFDPELFERIFIKENISGKEILDIKNTEQKAIAIYHAGYDKLIEELDAKKLDEWKTNSIVNGNIAVCELYEFNIERSQLRFVKVQDHSTGKTTVLGVPINDDTKTAKGAIAWTFGMKESEYCPEIET